ncbi:TIGR04141 family sporadically distributed protein [Prauserella alba]|uniref:TIGR04141 family sporadically distributed protein n=1 Tax=Prauserella alba TaxID=176898 RepID=UPI0031E4956F
MSVYRLQGGLSLAEYLLEPDDQVRSSDQELEQDGVSCLIRYGHLETHEPQWVSHARDLTGLSLSLPRMSPFAVLLIDEGKWVYALTWGDGYLMLDRETRADPGFGLAFAIRRLDEFHIGAMTLHSLDSSARTAQISYPGGADVGKYGVARFGEIVGRLRGSADLSDLTYGKSRKTKKDRIISGLDSLRVPVARQFDGMRSDLDAISRVVDSPTPDNSLRSVTAVRPIKSGHPMLPKLQTALVRSLKSKASKSVAQGTPLELAESSDELMSVKVLRLAGSGPMLIKVDELLEEIKGRIGRLDEHDVYDSLRTGSIQAYSDSTGTEKVRGTTSALKWLYFEKTIGNHRYILRSGSWYQIGENYVDQIRDEVSRLLENKYDVEFPLWNGSGQDSDENSYNKLAAERLGAVCLDAKFAKTTQNPKIELCDIYTSSHELVHVKWLGSASSLSHLIAQAEASISALTYEPAAMEWLTSQLNQSSKGRIIPKGVPSTVVLACGGRKWKARDLFAMSQINLLRFANALPPNVDLKFADIPYGPKPKAK